MRGGDRMDGHLRLATVSRSRYECKYAVDPDKVGEIRRFIRPFLRVDSHAASSPAAAYAVCSLYLDTPGLDLYQQTIQGQKNRLKLRIRSYADGDDAPVFLEIKRRVNGVVLKRRCGIRRREAERLLRSSSSAGTPPVPAESVPPGDAEDIEAVAEFGCLLALTGAWPVLRVRYMREAYEAADGSPTRVTFDTELSHVVTREADLSHNGGGWRPTPLDKVILELKFTERYPSWASDLVRVFELQRLSVPKYVMSMACALKRPDPLASAILSSPQT